MTWVWIVLGAIGVICLALYAALEVGARYDDAQEKSRAEDDPEEKHAPA